MPIIKSSVRKSKDGKFLIQQTTISYIKPVAYYEKVLSGEEKIEEAHEADLVVA